MPFSAANVIQAKTGSAENIDTATVTLDNPTREGSTVTVELSAAGINLFESGTVPANWEYDGASASFMLQAYRRPGIPAGESSWDFSYIVVTHWLWRVTEWDVGLDPISPLSGSGANVATGTGVTTFSSGTSTATDRVPNVALATHLWSYVSGPSAQSFDWSGHTNGFTERDELRVSYASSGRENDACWSWLFNDTGGSYETTATVNTTPRHANDTYHSLIVVYAATQPVIVPAPTVITSAGGGP